MYILSTAVFCALMLHCNLVVSAEYLSRDTPRIRNVRQFPNETSVENIAVRANGQLLVTILTSPELYQVNPFKPEPPVLVHRFPNAAGALGITETDPDVFAVITGSFTSTTNVPGSYSVWKVDMRASDGTRSSPAIISKVTDIPQGQLLNGATLLEKLSGSILIADSIGGLVWGLDTRTGEFQVVLEDALMEPILPNPLGINGLHIRGQFLYFTNSGQNILARVPVHLDNGTAAGPYETVANLSVFCDDFALDMADAAYIATNFENTIVKVRTGGKRAGNATIFEGGMNSTTVAGATAAAFGRTVADRLILYVTTTGGKILALNTTPS